MKDQIDHGQDLESGVKALKSGEQLFLEALQRHVGTLIGTMKGQRRLLVNPGLAMLAQLIQLKELTNNKGAENFIAFKNETLPYHPTVGERLAPIDEHLNEQFPEGIDGNHEAVLVFLEKVVADVVGGSSGWAVETSKKLGSGLFAYEHGKGDHLEECIAAAITHVEQNYLEIPEAERGRTDLLLGRYRKLKQALTESKADAASVNRAFVRAKLGASGVLPPATPTTELIAGFDLDFETTPHHLQRPGSQGGIAAVRNTQRVFIGNTLLSI